MLCMVTDSLELAVLLLFDYQPFLTAVLEYLELINP